MQSEARNAHTAACGGRCRVWSRAHGRHGSRCGCARGHGSWCAHLSSLPRLGRGQAFTPMKITASPTRLIARPEDQPRAPGRSMPKPATSGQYGVGSASAGAACRPRPRWVRARAGSASGGRRAVEGAGRGDSYSRRAARGRPRAVLSDPRAAAAVHDGDPARSCRPAAARGSTTRASRRPRGRRRRPRRAHAHEEVDEEAPASRARSMNAPIVDDQVLVSPAHARRVGVDAARHAQSGRGSASGRTSG